VGKHILILGGGFGGLAAADALRKGLTSEHKVTLVDRQPLFFMGLTKLWVLDGRRQVGEGPGNRTLLAKRGIDFLEGEVTAINIANHEVRVGKMGLTYDYLVIALGAEYSTSSPKGLVRYAKNLYTESGCAEIRDALRAINTGTLTVLVCGLPFKCPPAPYEASMIVDNVLRKRGVRGKVKMQIVTPEPHPLTILGPEAGKMVTSLLQERGIEYHPSESKGNPAEGSSNRGGQGNTSRLGLRNSNSSCASSPEGFQTRRSVRMGTGRLVNIGDIGSQRVRGR
jgi:sulfide:quinone oxidoreductase